MNYNLRNNLTTEEYAKYQKGKEILLNISMYSSPNKPSSKGYGAEDIKRKMFEPILQLYEWLFDIRIDADKLIDNNYRLFTLDISAGLVFDFKGTIAKFDLTLSIDQMQLIQNYVESTTMKEFYLIINKQFFVVHAVVKAEDTQFKIYGFAIDLETDYFANVVLIINRQTYNCEGKIAKNIGQDYVANQIAVVKNEILATIAETYVPKEDIKTIDTFNYGGKVYTPKTQNGFISIKTYNK